MGFEMFDHTGDLGIIVYGDTLRELFENAAHALLELIIGDQEVLPDNMESLDVSGQDWADLMVNWLRELLFIFNGRGRLPARIQITSLEPYRLRSGIRGEPYHPERHEILTEIKAVTYHQISVEKKSGHWEARVIFDI